MPYIQTTVQHGTLDQLNDAMDVWIESISTTEFEVCLRESRTFSGPHSSLYVVCQCLYYHNISYNISAGDKKVQFLIRSGIYLIDGHHM